MTSLPGVGNQGGFRACGRALKDSVRFVVLYTSGAEPLDTHGERRKLMDVLHDAG